jgi:hypothetical protein
MLSSGLVVIIKTAKAIKLIRLNSPASLSFVLNIFLLSSIVYDFGELIKQKGPLVADLFI